VDQLQEPELQVEALLLSVPKLVEGAEHDGEKARKIFFGEEGGGACSAVSLVRGDLEEVGGDAGGFCFGREACDLGDDGVAEVADELARELRSCVAGVEEAADDGEHVR
jgi:hypothetical protein